MMESLALVLEKYMLIGGTDKIAIKMKALFIKTVLSLQKSNFFHFQLNVFVCLFLLIEKIFLFMVYSTLKGKKTVSVCTFVTNIYI